MEANLFEDLGADSLDAVELSLAVEEKTGITIDEDAMAEIKTVADIVNYLEAHK
jgi:acyl carrier protein